MTTWHLHKNGKQLAPVSSQQLKQLATIGELAPDDLVWKDGMPEWVAAGKIKGLFPVADHHSSEQRRPTPVAAAAPTVPAQSNDTAEDERQFPVVALVGVVALVILVAVIGIVFWPSGDDMAVENNSTQAKDDAVALAFSDVDYSSDFTNVDYSIEPVDLSKGPGGEPIETRTTEVTVNSGLPEGWIPANEGYFDSNGKFVRTQPPGESAEPQVKNKVVAEGFVNADGEFVRHGKTVVYSQDGQLRISEAAYYQGELHGVETEWDAESTYVLRTTSFSHGQKHGPSIEYYSSGQKRTEMPWRNGKRHGIGRMWHPSGQLFQEGAFVDDHEHGPQTEWFDSGEKCVEVYSNHGVLHGPAREWFKNGQLRNQCQWVNGKMHGEMRHYDEQGTLLKVNQFDHGTLLSKRIPQLEPDETRGFTKQAFAVLQKEFNGRLENHPPGSRADFIQAMKVCGAQIIDTSLSNGITKFSVSEIPYEENGKYVQPQTFRRTLEEWTSVFGEFERQPDQYNSFVGASYHVWRYQCTDGPLTFSGSIYDFRGETFLSAGGMYFADHVPQD